LGLKGTLTGSLNIVGGEGRRERDTVVGGSGKTSFDPSSRGAARELCVRGKRNKEESL